MCAQTGDIGLFVVLGDSASSAGVRRIEALTGQAALASSERAGHRLAEIARGAEGASRRMCPSGCKALIG